jgi:hypothetical protein
MRKQPDALSPTPPHHSPAHISKKSHDINTKQEATAGSSKSKSKTRAAELKPLPYHFFNSFFLFAHTTKDGLPLRGNEEPHVYHMSRTSFQSILSLFFLFAPTTKGGLPARRNEDRALMLPNRTLQIFLSVFFSLLTQEKGRDNQRKEMKITRMLPNRTCKSFFQSLSLCLFAHTRKR